MKKISILFLILPLITKAQEDYPKCDPNFTSLNVLYSAPKGFSLELNSWNPKCLTFALGFSLFFQKQQQKETVAPVKMLYLRAQMHLISKFYLSGSTQFIFAEPGIVFSFAPSLRYLHQVGKKFGLLTDTGYDLYLGRPTLNIGIAYLAD